MEMCSSYMGSIFMLLCILFICVDGVQVDFCCVVYD